MTFPKPNNEDSRFGYSYYYTFLRKLSNKLFDNHAILLNPEKLNYILKTAEETASEI